MFYLARPLFISATLMFALLALPAGADTNHRHDKRVEEHSPAGTRGAQGEGTVKAINAGQQQVTLAHGPIEALGWPAMTMPFNVTESQLLEGISVGDRVSFELVGPDNRISKISRK